MYKKHLVSQDAPAPLTYAEEELAMIKHREVSVYEGCPKSSWTTLITLCIHAEIAFEDYHFFAHYTEYFHTKFK